MNISQSDIQHAVAILQEGGLVAFATETVYGLGGDARNPEAIAKIFLAKQRPPTQALNILISDVAQLSEWASDVPPMALQLAKAYWPGPLTIILKKAPHVLNSVTANQATVGLRVPNHPVALALLKAFGDGIAAPSANRYGHLSPTTAQAVQEELGDAVDLILEGGQCEIGMESTIVDLSGQQPIILRSGALSTKQIEEVLHQPVMVQKQTSHMMSRTPIKLMSADQIKEQVSFLMRHEESFVVLVRDESLLPDQHRASILMPDDAISYAHDLYQALREAEKKQVKHIIIEAFPENDEWELVREKLKKLTGLGNT